MKVPIDADRPAGLRVASYFKLRNQSKRVTRVVMATYTTCTLRSVSCAALDEITTILNVAGVNVANRGQLVELAVLTLLAELRAPVTSYVLSIPPESDDDHPPALASFPVRGWATAAAAVYLRDGVEVQVRPASKPEPLVVSGFVFESLRSMMASEVES